MPKKNSEKKQSHKGTSLFRCLGRNNEAETGDAAVENAPTSRDNFFRTSNLQTAKNLFETHFNVTLTKQGAPEWDIAALRRAWRAMEKVPESHVKGNDKLEYFVRREDWNPQSDYDGSGTIRMQYFHQTMLWTPYAWNIGRGSPLFWKNHFKEVVLHEVGHAVDNKGKYSEHFNPARWRDESDSAVATAFGQTYNGSQQEKDAVTALLKDAFFAGEFPKSASEARRNLHNELDSTSSGALRAMFWQNGHLDRAKLDSFLESDIVQGLLNAPKSPWTQDDGGKGAGLQIGERIYQKLPGFEPWVSYEASDQDKKLSNYQYRAQGEWFAEHYAAFYYSASTRAWLKQHDRYVYDFFKRVVDKDLPPPANLAEGRPAGDYDATAVFGPK